MWHTLKYAGYEFERSGSYPSAEYYPTFANPARKPVLFALAPGVSLEQTAVAFTLHPDSSDDATEQFASGAHTHCPHIDMFVLLPARLLAL